VFLALFQLSVGEEQIFTRTYIGKKINAKEIQPRMIPGQAQIYTYLFIFGEKSIFFKQNK